MKFSKLGLYYSGVVLVAFLIIYLVELYVITACKYCPLKDIRFIIEDIFFVVSITLNPFAQIAKFINPDYLDATLWWLPFVLQTLFIMCIAYILGRAQENKRKDASLTA